MLCADAGVASNSTRELARMMDVIVGEEDRGHAPEVRSQDSVERAAN